MNSKSIIFLVLKFIALYIVMFIAFSIGGVVMGQQATAEQTSASMLPLIIMVILNTTVLSYAIIRSKWWGLCLIAVVFITFFGTQTFMSQIETLIFIPSVNVGPIFLMGLITALIFSPLSVIILGKMKQKEETKKKNLRLIMPGVEWAWKLCVTAVIYIILYFTFGYFIAWQNPAVREFYQGSTKLLAFFPHFRNMLLTNPRLILIQLLRGILWAALALPVIRMMKGKVWETALVVGLLFAVVSSGLLLPNPYMPEPVRMAHLLEGGTSNFIFGLIAVWLLNRHHSSFRDFFKGVKEEI
ncbi:MAG: hypothetical protein U9O65_01895 [Thermotogota bacterium]|nr:hypothetical protein [Thermotogota bacterium]